MVNRSRVYPNAFTVGWMKLSRMARGGRPPGRARSQVDDGGRMTHHIEGAGIPARPRPDVLGNLVGKEETEIGSAEGRLGDSLDLLQHPRAEADVRDRARADRLPRPGELDTRQMNVDPHEMQRCRKRDEHNRFNCPTEDQAHRDYRRGPLHPGQDPAPTSPAGITLPPIRALRADAAGGMRLPRW